MPPVNVTLIVEAMRHRVPGGIGVATQALRDGLMSREDVTVEEYWARGGPTGRSSRLPRPLLYEAWSRFSRPRARTSDADVVHAPMLFGPTSGDAATMFTVHDLAWRGVHDVRSQRSAGLHERMWRRVVASTATVVTSTQAMARVLVDSGLPVGRCVVIPLGVASRSGIEPSDELVPSGPYVLSVSTLEPRKNLAGLLEGFHLSRLWADGYELVIVGPDGWEIDVAKLVESQPTEVARCVTVLGFVSDADLAGLFHGARVAAYPSFSEGFGLPVLEAMSWGTPVVTSAIGSTAEVAGDAAVLVDPADTADIAAGLRAAADPARRLELAAAGLARAADLSWERHVEQTVELYQSLRKDNR